jgi:hypothetical protein
MAKHETLQQRHLRSLDQASDLTGAGRRRFFGAPKTWTSTTTVGAILPRGNLKFVHFGEADYGV